MKKSQYFFYSGITLWVFEELCDVLKTGIERSLERRGLKGPQNLEFRQMVIGETTAFPLFIKYSAFISTELDSGIAKMNNSGLQIERIPIDPLDILKAIQAKLEKAITWRNRLVHNSWSPQLLSDERLAVKAFRRKMSKNGASIEISKIGELDFKNFIKSCETLQRMIRFLDHCLDTNSSLERYFEIEDEEIVPTNEKDMEEFSVLSEMSETIKALGKVG
jgi:uncharacterized protein YutE (UPF0331/DUF86 family)